MSQDRQDVETSSIQDAHTAMEPHVASHLSDNFDDLNLDEVVPDEGEDSIEELRRQTSAVESKSMLAAIVALVEKMQPTRPEILRAVPTYQVVSGLGKVFWSTKHKDFFPLSRVTEGYDEFLSHSWQVESWQKAMLLIILKNGLPAVILGTCGALLMMFLWQLGFLPGYAKAHLRFSCWCSCAGLLLLLLAIVFWRPRGSMFVDRICINQIDPRMKAEGIMNIGAVLNVSNSLLVVFDESYAERLWCVYELAAFLKAQQARDPEKPPQLKVKPLLLGFVACSVCTSLLVLGIFAVLNPVDNLILLWCVLFLFMCLEGIYLVHAFRGYFRSLEATHRQLQQFQLQNAFCWCCSVNHVHPVNGQPIPVCDREIVRQCITSWFGAEQNFDQSVRSVVAQALRRQLGCDAFPYSWVLGSSVPILWPLIDYLASYQANEDVRHLVPFFLIRGVAMWLWGIPIVATVGIFFARCFRAQAKSRCTDLFKTLLVLLCASVGPGVVIAWWLYTELIFFQKDDTLGSVVFAAGCFAAFLAVRNAYHFSNKRYFKSLDGAEMF